ncbi:hypothetical protein HDU76_009056 [Blyttiomyces sp. JEL0837]|nr:hypothetical protein HDU76_009056 [Blyttiomyces sp. JEL0837]
MMSNETCSKASLPRSSTSTMKKRQSPGSDVTTCQPNCLAAPSDPFEPPTEPKVKYPDFPRATGTSEEAKKKYSDNVEQYKLLKAHIEGQNKFYEAAQARCDNANKAVALLWDLYPKYLLDKAKMKTQSIKEIIETIRQTFETTEGKHQAHQQWPDDWGRLHLSDEAKKTPKPIMQSTTKLIKLLRQGVDLGDEGKNNESLLADAISK